MKGKYEERLTYREMFQEAGNSTIQVVLLSNAEREMEIREIFEKIECESEGTGTGYFAMEVPYHLNYAPIREKLNELLNEKLIDYAESCLSKHHEEE